MIEKCGCKVTVNPKTQFESVEPCEKHNSLKRTIKWLLSKRGQKALIGSLKRSLPPEG